MKQILPFVFVVLACAASAEGLADQELAARIALLGDSSLGVRQEAEKRLMEDESVSAAQIRGVLEQNGDLEIKERLARILEIKRHPPILVEFLYREGCLHGRTIDPDRPSKRGEEDVLFLGQTLIHDGRSGNEGEQAPRESFHAADDQRKEEGEPGACQVVGFDRSGKFVDPIDPCMVQRVRLAVMETREEDRHLLLPGCTASISSMTATAETARSIKGQVLIFLSQIWEWENCVRVWKRTLSLSVAGVFS